jgi:hypothetical protein
MTAEGTNPEDMTSEEMATYGITRVPVDQLLCGELRYTRLTDVIAEAKCHPEAGRKRGNSPCAVRRSRPP